MKKNTVKFEDIKKMIESKYPLKVGAGAILKGLSTEQVLKGYCILYDNDWQNKEYVNFKYVVYSGNIYFYGEE